MTVTKLHCEGVPSNQINWSITPPANTPDSWCTFALLFSSNLDGISVGNNGRSANIANPTEVRAVQSAVYHDEIYPGWALCHHRKGGGVWPQINTWILVTKWWLIANFIASGKNRSSQQAGGSGEGRKHAFIDRTKIFSFHGSLRNILFGAFGVQYFLTRFRPRLPPSSGLYPWVFLQVLVGLRVYQSD